MTTPSRRDPVKRIARESYPSFATLADDRFTEDMLKAVGNKIQQEIAFISSDKANTLLNRANRSF